jgi:Holliday junction DNA helicase RuvA
MVNYITGIVKVCEKQLITLDIGSMGLAIQVPNASAFTVQEHEKITVYTYVHWNPENGPALFGFLTELERTVFLLVIGCSGIGPKIALAVLDGMPPHQFLDAIQTGNEGALSKISGIGAKKAEQMIVQLKHKVAQLLKSGIDLGDQGSATQWNTISEVLSSLNYSPTEINRTIKYLNDNHVQEALSFDKMMRHALSFLSKHK